MRWHSNLLGLDWKPIDYKTIRRKEMETPIFKFALTEELNNACKILRENPSENCEYIPLPSDFIPSRQDPKATGFDVRCASPRGFSLYLNYYYKIPLGFRIFAPEGWWLELAPRSSTFTRLNLNSLYGKVDQLYEGQAYFCVQYLPDTGINTETKRIEFGDRIAQLIPVKRQEMKCEQITNREYDQFCKERGGLRGAGGYGSSGVK